MHDVAREQLAEALRGAGLRVTAARVGVARALQRASGPLSHREVAERIPDVDPATVFRNLVTLVDAGLATRVDMGDHVWRYAVSDDHAHRGHGHAHFTCIDCGETKCVDDVEVTVGGAAGPWAGDVEVQLRGHCDDCG